MITDQMPRKITDKAGEHEEWIEDATSDVSFGHDSTGRECRVAAIPVGIVRHYLSTLSTYNPETHCAVPKEPDEEYVIRLARSLYEADPADLTLGYMKKQGYLSIAREMHNCIVGINTAEPLND